MRVERSGSQRWLVVPGTADKLWPQVREFWQENGFILNVDRPEIGVMETDWAENRAKIDNGIIRRTIGKVIDGLYSTPERDKYRTRLESAGESGFGGDLHQPPGHDGNLSERGQGPDHLAASCRPIPSSRPSSCSV
jgi:hypothetical protein